MENRYSKSEKNNNDDIILKPKIDFEFIRQRNIYKENINIENKKNYYSMLQKTNNIFGNKSTENYNYENKIYNKSKEEKENINFYSNQNNINDNNNNIESKINIVKNEINEVENNINFINKNINEEHKIFIEYGNNYDNNRMNINYGSKINNERDINNLGNDKFSNNSHYYYFNYNSDESFNRLNESNTKLNPIDIKLNSMYNKKITNTINSNNIDYIYSINSLNSEIKNVDENNVKNYEDYIVNEIEKRNKLNNKNAFGQTNNDTFHNYYNFKQYNSQNNLRKDYSSKSLNLSSNNLIAQEQYNLNYNINAIQNSKSNNNIFNNYNNSIKGENDSFYNTEKKINIKPYFQLKEKERIFNYKIKNLNNQIISNKNNQNFSSLMNKTFNGKNYFNNNRANINIIDNQKNYQTFYLQNNNLGPDINFKIGNNMTPKSTLGNMNSNYRIDTYNNKKDEMTQTIPINDNKKFYSLTQNRSYRNQSKFTIDNISQNNDNSLKKMHLYDKDIINNKVNYDVNYYKEFEIQNNKLDENVDDNKEFNTLLNYNLHKHNYNNNGCIHGFNSFRQKKFNKNRANLLSRNNQNSNSDFNGINRNICQKCLKSRKNFVGSNHIRICKHCQNHLNNSKFKIDENNYFTFN